jgi:hypothetical protein
MSYSSLSPSLSLETKIGRVTEGWRAPLLRKQMRRLRMSCSPLLSFERNKSDPEHADGEVGPRICHLFLEQKTYAEILMSFSPLSPSTRKHQISRTLGT